MHGEALREAHLFAGAGGGILGGMLLGHTPVLAVEIDDYCRRVLAQRQRDELLPAFPIFGDIKDFDGRPWKGRVDLVSGGFPCQPWGMSGKKLGREDPRHLWPEMARVVGEIRPRFVFAENVDVKAFEQPYHDLRGMGYRVPPMLQLGAVDVGSPHRRSRWWLLAADSDGDRCEGPSLHVRSGRQEPAEAVTGRSGAKVAEADTGRLQGQRNVRRSGVDQEPARGRRWWRSEPRLGRVAHGVPSWVDRIKALGNAQVPTVAATAFQILMDKL